LLVISSGSGALFLLFIERNSGMNFPDIKTDWLMSFDSWEEEEEKEEEEFVYHILFQ